MQSSASTSASAAPIRCLLVQMGTLDDTIQSLMAARAAKQLYPTLEIHCICKEYHQDVFNRVSWIDKVYTFPIKEVLEPLMQKNKDKPLSISKTARWLSPIISRHWDIVVNWTYNDASSFLASIFPAMHRLGYCRGKDLSFACSDDWSLYVNGILSNQIRQNIHRTDILTTQLLTLLQIHYGNPTPSNQSVTSKDFFDLELEESDLGWQVGSKARRWVGIQIDQMEWQEHEWAYFIGSVLTRFPNYNIALLGSRREVEFVKRLLGELALSSKHAERVINLVGRTDFALWTSIVGQCQWVVCHENPVIQLASVLGTRVLLLGSDEAYWEERGPYGNDHIIISAADGLISPSFAFETWAYFVEKKERLLAAEITEALKAVKEVEWTRYKVMKSRIRPTSDGGGVVYESQSNKTMELNDWLSIVLGQVARYWYCGWVAPVGFEVPRSAIHPSLLKELRKISEGTDVLQKICSQAFSTATLLAEKGARLKSQKLMNLQQKQELANLGAKLRELDKLIEKTSRIHSAFLAFSKMSQVMMNNLEGESVHEIATSSAKGYKRISEGLKIFKEWVVHTLALAKPIMISNQTSQVADLGIGKEPT